MPFVQQEPRIFNRSNIEAIKPGLVGVYSLFKYYVDEILNVDRSLREKQLITELNPLCNQKIG